MIEDDCENDEDEDDKQQFDDSRSAIEIDIEVDDRKDSFEAKVLLEPMSPTMFLKGVDEPGGDSHCCEDDHPFNKTFSSELTRISAMPPGYSPNTSAFIPGN